MVKIDMPNENGKYGFAQFLNVISILRSPQGCPWDREQTHKSIRNELLEESYEVADAIDRADTADLCEELGDVLLQVVMHSQMAKEYGEFDISDVIDGVCRKMINRHPHVFGNAVAETSEQVLNNWDANKKVEKHQQSYTDTLKAVPAAFPALMRAAKVQKRASRAGFDWPDVNGAFEKISEESAELASAVKNNNPESISEELGDLLFSVVNAARFLKVNPEEALQKSTEKFISRFNTVEALANGNLENLSLSELDKLWEKAKQTH